MSQLVARYLQHRRNLGYRLRVEGGQLVDFARYADAMAPKRPMTIALALKWATLPGRTKLYHAKRLELLRGFARYCHALDSRTEIPPPGLLGPAHRRITPHIYSTAEVRLLLHRATTLGRAHPGQPQTFATLLGLAACTGMRSGELLRLRVSDLDSRAGTLRVARSKFSPERLLPLHPSAIVALEKYIGSRSAHSVYTEHLFVGPRGYAFAQRSMHEHFRKIAADIPGNGERPRPRLHDFRHAFASQWIADWSRSNAPISHHLLLLSRYLGHRHFTDTFWYVTSNAKSLANVAARFRRYYDGVGRDHHHEPLILPLARAAILRRTSSHAAQSQRPNARGLRRYVPPFSAVSLPALSTADRST